MHARFARVHVHRVPACLPLPMTDWCQWYQDTPLRRRRGPHAEGRIQRLACARFVDASTALCRYVVLLELFPFVAPPRPPLCPRSDRQGGAGARAGRRRSRTGRVLLRGTGPMWRRMLQRVPRGDYAARCCPRP